MLLAIDTSGPLCSAALIGGDIAASRSDDIGRGHAEHLMPMLEEFMASKNAGFCEIDRIVCTTGPGSFTGLRVGLAAARGLALALDCPCIGVTVFEAFAETFSEGEPLCVAMDARRDQVWMQCFDADGQTVTEPCAYPLEGAADAIPAGIGRIAGSAAPLILAQRDDLIVDSDAASPPLMAIARAALNIPAGTGRPRPLYLRAPDAKPQAALKA